MNSLRQIAIVVAVVVFAAAVSASAQQAGALTGVVRDSTSGILPGVTVTVLNLDTGASRQAITGGDGRYTVAALAPGRYKARAALDGFSPVEVEMTLRVGQTLAADLVLGLSTLKEVITVQALAAQVDTVSATVALVVDQKLIADLPLNGRGWAQLATIMAGVNQFTSVNTSSVGFNPPGVRLAISGANDKMHRILWDGVNANDVVNATPGGVSGQMLGVDALQEFKVMSSSYPAEFGGASGAVIAAVTKSGANQFSGSFFEFNRNKALNARDYFSGPEKPGFQRNQFGGTVGGPIRRNKIFFLGAYEGLIERLTTSNLIVTPNTAARNGMLPDGPVTITPGARALLNSPVLPVPNGRDLGDGTGEYRYNAERPIDEHFFLGRADIQLATSNRLYGRYNQMISTSDLPIAGGHELFTHEEIKNLYSMVEDQHVFGVSTVATVRGTFTRTDTQGANRASFDVSPELQVLPGRTGGVPPQLLVGPVTYGSSRGLPIGFIQNLYGARADVTVVKGAHTLKFGGNVERYVYDMGTQTRLSGQFNFANFRQVLEGRPSVGLFYGGGFIPGATDGYGTYGNFYLETYAQDTWAVASNLTINLGLRYEPTTTVTERTSEAVRINDFDPNDFAQKVVLENGVDSPYDRPSMTQIAPRVGLSWDIGGDHKTVVRSGWGLYYQPMLFWYALNYLAAPGGLFQISSPQFPNALDSLGTGPQPPPAPFLLARKMDTPYVSRWNAGVQRDLGWGTTIDVNYVGSRGYNQVMMEQLNGALPQRQSDGSLLFVPGTPRRNPTLGGVVATTTRGKSWYNGLLIQLSKRMSDGLQFESAYTLAKSEDYKSGLTGGNSAIGESGENYNVYDPAMDKGLSAFDVRHTFSAAVTYLMPYGRSPRNLLEQLFGGWQVGAVVSMRSGMPFTPAVNGNWTGFGPLVGEGRPNWAPGRNAENAIIGTQRQWFDPTAFVLPPRGTFGEVPRNALEGPSLRTVDVSLMKNVTGGVFGSTRLQLRLEVFNLFNRANFDLPVRSVYAGVRADERPLGTAGLITNTVTPGRQAQIGVKFLF